MEWDYRIIVDVTSVLFFLSSLQTCKSCSSLFMVHIKHSTKLSDHPDPWIPLSFLNFYSTSGQPCHLVLSIHYLWLK